jgi:hypothetical protein
MTHTEIVHILFGGAVAAMGLAAYPRWAGGRRLRYLWPSLAFLIGFFLFIPVESGTRTYAVSGWWDTFRDAFPDWGESWSYNFTMRHIIQHKITGLLAMLVGLIETGRAAGWLRRPVWGRLLPFFSIAVGLFLGIHGGTHMHLPSRVEQLHHWILGAAFVGGGIVLWLVQAQYLRGPRWADVWPTIVLLAGLDLVFFYRLP